MKRRTETGIAITTAPLLRSRLMDEWQLANHDMLWGWKRDAGNLQRVILFGGQLRLRDEALHLNDWMFFYRSRGQTREISQMAAVLDCDEVRSTIGLVTTRMCPRTQLTILELRGGPGLAARRPLIQRLLNRRPRKFIPEGVFPSSTQSLISLQSIGPVAAYVGSGVSYEAGLPTLASVHETFDVDRIGDDNFTFGNNDTIPQELSADVKQAFERFVSFHIEAAVAQPSISHGQLASLQRRGVITRILTDNVDNLFAKLGVPFTRTRGIGIFNDRYPVHFDRGEKILLVIGVAADRRAVIQQARQQGIKIIVVNPHAPVSPRSQSLSYMRPCDTWYAVTAQEFFESYVTD